MRKNRWNSNSPSANIWGLAASLEAFQAATESGVTTPTLPDGPSICRIRIVTSRTGLGVEARAGLWGIWYSRYPAPIPPGFATGEATAEKGDWICTPGEFQPGELSTSISTRSQALVLTGLSRSCNLQGRAVLTGSILAWFERQKATPPSGLWTSIWRSSW
jgi:hypothetical protein